MSTEEWLNSVASLQGCYEVLPPAVTERMLDTILRSAQETSQRSLHLHQDISDLDTESVRSALLSNQPSTPKVCLLWPFIRYGVSMSYEDFANNYDDLWYPSRDDLLVTTATQDWVLELNHEEILTVSVINQKPMKDDSQGL